MVLECICNVFARRAETSVFGIWPYLLKFTGPSPLALAPYFPSKKIFLKVPTLDSCYYPLPFPQGTPSTTPLPLPHSPFRSPPRSFLFGFGGSTHVHGSCALPCTLGLASGFGGGGGGRQALRISHLASRLLATSTHTQAPTRMNAAVRC